MAFYQEGNKKLRGESTFEGGVNTGTSLFDISASETTDEVGFDTDSYPARVTKKGRTGYGLSGAAQTNLLAHYGNTHLVRAVGTALQYNSAGDVWTAIAGAFTNADWDYTNYNGKLLMTNGTDEVKSWNGTVLSNLNAGVAPKGSFITSSINRVYLALGSSIHFSGNNVETDWTSSENSGIDDFTVNGGDITGLTYFRDQVTVFKSNAMGVYYGNNYFTQKLAVVSNDIGCTSFKTIVEIGESLFWLGQNDVYIYQGGKPLAIGQNIRYWLDNINKAQLSKCCAFTDGIRYYLCLVTGSNTEPNIRLVFDPRHNVWRIPALSESYRYGTQLNNITYVGDSAGLTFQEFNGTTNNGSAIVWSLTTKPFDEKTPEAEKTYLDLHLQGLFATGTTLVIAVSTEDRNGTFVAIGYDPTTASDYTQNRNVVIPLDTVPLAYWSRYRISGTGPVELQKWQRYYRVQRVQR